MSFSDAFVKAGLVSPEKAKKIEDEKDRAEQDVQEKAKKQKRAVKEGPEISLSQEEYTRLEKLWKGEKSKGFMKHLIWAFLPYTVLEKVWGDDATEEKLDKECCLCRRKIISVAEAVEKAGEKAVENIRNQLKFEMDNKDRLDTEVFKKEYAEFLNKMGEDTFGKKKFGWKSPESTKVLCFPCYQVFYNWVAERILRGDKSVNGVVNRRMRSLKGKSR